MKVDDDRFGYENILQDFKFKKSVKTAMDVLMKWRKKRKYTSSSSSYRAGSTDIPDPLSPLLPIVHRPR